MLMTHPNTLIRQNSKYCRSVKILTQSVTLALVAITVKLLKGILFFRIKKILKV